MAEVAPGRSTRARCPRWARVVTVVALVATIGAIAPAGAQTSPSGDTVDVGRFSARAAAWSAANVVHQEAAVQRAIELGEEAAAAEEAERLAALEAAAAAAAAATSTTTAAPTTTAPPTTTAAPAPTTTVTEDAPAETPTTTTTAAPAEGGPTAEQWDALRQCESGGRYDALSPGGRYRGAYQFSQATWDWVASFANPALVGVDPAAASVADQDAQARALYDRQGASPWPHCGRHLP